jgi:hypothetical protein
MLAAEQAQADARSQHAIATEKNRPAPTRLPPFLLQDEDHAARLARFAIDAMATAADTILDPDGPDPDARVQIRIGLHCGPVSARFAPTPPPPPHLAPSHTALYPFSRSTCQAQIAPPFLFWGRIPPASAIAQHWTAVLVGSARDGAPSPFIVRARGCSSVVRRAALA